MVSRNTGNQPLSGQSDLPVRTPVKTFRRTPGLIDLIPTQLFCVAGRVDCLILVDPPRPEDDQDSLKSPEDSNLSLAINHGNMRAPLTPLHKLPWAFRYAWDRRPCRFTSSRPAHGGISLDARVLGLWPGGLLLGARRMGSPPRAGVLWTPGYWGFAGGVYAWHAGYWGPHVGFYGGINYGFGYGGVGFVGGEWRGESICL